MNVKPNAANLDACPECENIAGTPHALGCGYEARLEAREKAGRLLSPRPARWVRIIVDDVIRKRRRALEGAAGKLEAHVEELERAARPLAANAVSDADAYRDELRKTKIRIRELEEVEAEILGFLNL